MTAEEYINHLHLEPHPEGGYYKQSYCSNERIPLTVLPPRFTGSRPFSTAIYYLLNHEDFSGFHRIKSDECWHFYAGQTLYIHVILQDGNYYNIKLGNDLLKQEVFQYIVPANSWFAVENAPGTNFGLVGCTVAPGFDFADFEMADKITLQGEFPQHFTIVSRLCR
jgi:uncharacterized protein